MSECYEVMPTFIEAVLHRLGFANVDALAVARLYTILHHCQT